MLLILAGCNGAKGPGDIPAQSYLNALSAAASPHGDLAGQILYPSEYTQISTRFKLNGLIFVTHPDGRFRVNQVPVGKHSLEVQVKGYEVAVLAIDITEGKTQTLPPLRLMSAKGRVLGRLVDDKGRSAENVEVKLSPVGDVAISDGDGIFTFFGVSGGDLTLTVSSSDFFAGNRHFFLAPNAQHNLGNITLFRQNRGSPPILGQRQ